MIYYLRSDVLAGYGNGMLTGVVDLGDLCAQIALRHECLLMLEEILSSWVLSICFGPFRVSV